MWYKYTIEYYSGTKKNDIINFADKWLELEKILLSEVTQIQKYNHHKSSPIGSSQSSRSSDVSTSPE